MKELNEVSPRRLAEYKAIRAKVDAKAKRHMLKEIGRWASARVIGFGNIRNKSCVTSTT